jgi:hypothetical protein
MPDDAMLRSWFFGRRGALTVYKLMRDIVSRGVIDLSKAEYRS